MARPAADSVKVLWTGTGTGTMSLGAAVSGFSAFPAALNGKVVSYSIEHENGTERENGIGTYTSAGTTLSRNLVTFSTAGAPTKVNFTSGNKFVRLAALAHDFIENVDTVDPAVTDDIDLGYIAGRSRWLNSATGTLFFCIDHTDGAAVWVSLFDLLDSGVFGAVITALTEITTLDQTNDMLVLFDATDSLAKKIRWTGRLEVSIDSANYSAAGSPTNAPYTPVNRNRHTFFTGAFDHIIEIPAGLSITPPVYGVWYAPPANTLTIRRVAASAVSINGVATDVYTWIVPAGGMVHWLNYDTNTVHLWGDQAGDAVLSGNVDFADFSLIRPHLRDFSETLVTDATFSGSETADFSAGSVYSVTLTGNVTALAITNPPATGRVGVITFRIIQDGTGGRSWAHPSGIRWPGGVAPTLPTGATDVSIISYLTFNGGTNWYGFEGGLDFL